MRIRDFRVASSRRGLLCYEFYEFTFPFPPQAFGKFVSAEFAWV